MKDLLLVLATFLCASNSFASYCDSASNRVKQVYCKNEKARLALEDLQKHILSMSNSFAGLEKELFLRDRSNWLERAAYNCLTDPRPGPFEACAIEGLEQMQQKLTWLESVPAKIDPPVARSEPSFLKFCENAVSDEKAESHELIVYLKKYFAAKDCTQLQKKQNATFEFGDSAIPETPEYVVEQKFPEKLNSLEALAYFPYITKVSLGYGTLVHDLTPLSHLTWLREISASASKISSLAPLQGLMELEEVDVRSTQVTDIRPLFNHPRLTRLDLRHLKVPKDQILDFKVRQPKTFVETRN